MTTAATVTRFTRRALDAALLAIVAIVLVGIVFARVIPAVTGGTTLVVSGPSMAPAIPLGAAVHAIPVTAERLATGDVVSIRVGPQQAVFTHRIIRLVARADGLWIETKGDANAEPDPAIVPASSIIGRVEVTVPVLGYLITLLTEPEGVMFILGIAGSLLATVWLLETLELDQQTSLRRRRATVAAGANASLRREVAAEPLAHTLGIGEPISRRPIDEAVRGEPPTALPPPGGPGTALRRAGVGDRLASIRETRARRARWETGRAHTGIWLQPVELAPVETPGVRSRQRRGSGGFEPGTVPG